jgi:hypothetical protein
MMKYALVTAATLALAAGSAQAGGKMGVGGGDGRSGADGNGVQLNGIPASGFAVETVQLPNGAPFVQRSGHETQNTCANETAGGENGVQLAQYGRGRLVSTIGGRSGNGVELNGIPASGSAVETVEVPDGTVAGGGWGSVGGGSDGF